MAKERKTIEGAKEGPKTMKIMKEGIARRSARLRVTNVGEKVVDKGRVGEVVMRPPRRTVSSWSCSWWSS